MYKPMNRQQCNKTQDDAPVSDNSNTYIQFIWTW